MNYTDDELRTILDGKYTRVERSLAKAMLAERAERIKAGESASSGEYPYINIVKLAWSKLRERDCLPEELHEGDMVRALQAVAHLLPTQPSTSQAEVRGGDEVVDSLIDALDHRHLCHASGTPEWPSNCGCEKHAAQAEPELRGGDDEILTGLTYVIQWLTLLADAKQIKPGSDNHSRPSDSQMWQKATIGKAVENARLLLPNVRRAYAKLEHLAAHPAEPAQVAPAPACSECALASAKISDAERNLRIADQNVEMYASAWAREIGAPYRAKTHRIDSLVLTTKDRMAELSKLRDAAAVAQTAQVPAWVLEPTKEMKAAFDKSQECCDDPWECNHSGRVTFSWGVVEPHFKAMLAAAPTPTKDES